MPGSPATTGRSLAQTKDHVGLPIADILANISKRARTASSSTTCSGRRPRASIWWATRTTPTAPSSRARARGWNGAATARTRSSAGAAAPPGPETCARAVAAMGEPDGPRRPVRDVADQLPRGRLEVPVNDFILVPLISQDSAAARYYMSVHAAEPILDWSLAPPCPRARVRSVRRSPNAGARVPV